MCTYTPHSICIIQLLFGNSFSDIYRSPCWYIQHCSMPKKAIHFLIKHSAWKLSNPTLLWVMQIFGRWPCDSEQMIQVVHRVTGWMLCAKNVLIWAFETQPEDRFLMDHGKEQSQSSISAPFFFLTSRYSHMLALVLQQIGHLEFANWIQNLLCYNFRFVAFVTVAKFGTMPLFLLPFGTSGNICSLSHNNDRIASFYSIVQLC